MSTNSAMLPPLIGLGTFRIQGADQIKSAVNVAIKSGIRHIDTASIYKNEEEIGESLRELIHQNIVTRQDIYITSKISPYEQGKDSATAAISSILARLGPQVGDYLDLLLIHWPGAAKTELHSPFNAERRRETWLVLEEFYKTGVVKALGVSNYEITHLEDLLSYCTVPPLVNQIECHPAWPQEDLRRYCNEKSITVVAYSSFGAGALFDEGQFPEVQQIAQKTNKTPAQVLLCWGLHKRMRVLPKSAKASRIQEFAHLLPLVEQARELGEESFLSKEDELLLDNIGIVGSERRKKYCWDPSGVV